MDWFDNISKRVRSPRGKMADKEAIYQELCQRLGIEQDVERQAPRPMLWRRVAAAACIVLVVAIGVAGIYQYQASQETEQPSVSVPSSAIPEQIAPLAFDNQPLSQIAATLSKRFNTPVTIDDPTLSKYRMTATFSSDESLPEILSALATAGRFHFIRRDQGYCLIP